MVAKCYFALAYLRVRAIIRQNFHQQLQKTPKKAPAWNSGDEFGMVRSGRDSSLERSTILSSTLRMVEIFFHYDEGI